MQWIKPYIFNRKTEIVFSLSFFQIYSNNHVFTVQTSWICSVRLKMSSFHSGHLALLEHKWILKQETSKRFQSISATSFVRRGIRQQPYWFSNVLQIGWRFAAVNQAANQDGCYNLSNQERFLAPSQRSNISLRFQSTGTHQTWEVFWY